MFQHQINSFLPVAGSGGERIVILSNFTKNSAMVNMVQSFIEKNAFGVCSRLGEKMGISTEVVRLYFIYASFFTFGSPIVIYMALAFWMNLKNYLRRGTRVKEII